MSDPEPSVAHRADPPKPIVERCIDLLVDPPPAVRLIAASAAVALTATLLHQGAQPHAAGLIPAPWDKLAHGLLFGMIGALAWIVLGGRGRRARIGAIAMAAGIGLLDEVAQHFLPGRTASLADLAADCIGAIVAVGLLSALRSRRLRGACASDPSGLRPGLRTGPGG